MKKIDKPQPKQYRGQVNLTDAPGREKDGKRGEPEQPCIEMVGTCPSDASKFDQFGHKVK